MRVCGFILISVSAGVASTVVSAQVTAKFKAERERLETKAAASPAAQRLTEGETLHNRLVNPFTDPGTRIQKVLPGGSLAVTVAATSPQAQRSCPSATGSHSPAPHFRPRPIPPA
jgi:hypothetical protein